MEPGNKVVDNNPNDLEASWHKDQLKTNEEELAEAELEKVSGGIMVIAVSHEVIVNPATGRERL